MRRVGASAPGAGAGLLRGFLQVYKANIQAAHVRYAAIAPVPIVLFKALEKGPDLDETPAGLIELSVQESWGWERFAAGSVGIVNVPGAHLSMLSEPHVGVLARTLDAALQSAGTAAHTGRAGVGV